MLSPIDKAMNESRPVVGSSQNKIDGSVKTLRGKFTLKVLNNLKRKKNKKINTSDANDNLRLSPPDIPLIFLSGIPIIVFSLFLRLNFLRFFYQIY